MGSQNSSNINYFRYKSLKLRHFNFAIPLLAFAGLGALGIAAINQDVDPNASATNTSTLTGTFSYGEEYITISNNSVIDLGSTELSASSAYVYATDNVTVSTNSPTGYDLYLSSGDSDNAALTTPSSYTEIAATSGTGGSGGTPAVLDADSYGYAVTSDIIGNTGFDTDYSNPNGSTSKWAGVPAGHQDRIRSTTSAVTDGETTAVHYGANVTNYLAPGQYTGQVTYSAVVTPQDNDVTATISPTSGMYKDILTITSGPKDTISTTHPLDTSEVEIIFSQNGETKDYCDVSNIDTSAGYLVTTCSAPNLTTGTYDIEIIVPRYGFKDQIPNGYTSNYYYGATILDITMQDMTSSVCSGFTAFQYSKAVDTTYLMRDSRDGSYYMVRRLSDNHCWMVQNLRLLNKVLSTSDSDISNSFTVPDSTSTYKSDSTTTGVWCGTSSSACDDKSLTYYNDDVVYGAYYNWYTATAGSGTHSTSSSSVGYSICPKGWKLPKGDQTDYSWYKLYTSYSSNASNFKTATNTGSNYWAGHYSDGSLKFVDSQGFWWSRTAYSNANFANYLSISSSSTTPQSSNAKHSGNSVRCVFVGE